jgi:hypothetical protein
MEMALLMENKRRKTETKSKKVSNYNENQIRPGTKNKSEKNFFAPFARVEQNIFYLS